jgi:hypothetical protein
MYDDDTEEGYLDLAQICLNGHVVNEYARSQPRSNQDFCARCGERTITQCQHCNTEIQGRYRVPGVIGGQYHRPSFCYKCGTPFPWTVTGIEAALELASTAESLTEADKAELSKAIDDLVKNTPRAGVAEAKFKSLMKRSGRKLAEGLKSVLIDIVSETVKRSLFGP